MPTQQTIVEMEITDSESHSDEGIVERNPPKQVLEEPPNNNKAFSIWEHGLQNLSCRELLIGRKEKKWGAHYFLRENVQYMRNQFTSRFHTVETGWMSIDWCPVVKSDNVTKKIVDILPVDNLITLYCWASRGRQRNAIPQRQKNQITITSLPLLTRAQAIVVVTVMVINLPYSLCK